MAATVKVHVVLGQQPRRVEEHVVDRRALRRAEQLRA
jgi:hypothetical protein